ncbi:MAG: glycosyltransferase family 2 protein [Acidobacteriota bacterium]
MNRPTETGGRGFFFKVERLIDETYGSTQLLKREEEAGRALRSATSASGSEALTGHAPRSAFRLLGQAEQISGAGGTRAAGLLQREEKLYFFLLGVAGLTTAGMLWFTWTHRHASTTFLHAYSLSLGLLGAAITLAGMGVLGFRIWMACRYRPYPCVTDEALPTVTVVIPAFNEGCQVLQTIRSVMASRYPPSKLQVVAVDDGSTDDTWAWLKRAKREFPTRLLTLRQKINGGKRRALMAGFQQAAGTIYVSIDSDSEIPPETLCHLVSPFVLDPRVGAVAGNVRVLNRDEGVLPKMMEVSFTAAFDFIRSGQSVFGGVLCTPGALSAYRASAVRGELPAWLEQRFLGNPATIGEDRALTNRILRSGYRVVYQREAVVLTKLPVSYGGLRRMMLRWARSNVRESMVLGSFLFTPFRVGDTGKGWLRLMGSWHLFLMSVGEALKLSTFMHLFLAPMDSLRALLSGALLASLVPAIVYLRRHRSGFGFRWALPYSLFWLVGLSWLSAWALVTARTSRWLTRQPPQPGPSPSLSARIRSPL